MSAKEGAGRLAGGGEEQVMSPEADAPWAWQSESEGGMQFQGQKERVPVCARRRRQELRLRGGSEAAGKEGASRSEMPALRSHSCPQEGTKQTPGWGPRRVLLHLGQPVSSGAEKDWREVSQRVSYVCWGEEES